MIAEPGQQKMIAEPGQPDTLEQAELPFEVPQFRKTARSTWLDWDMDSTAPLSSHMVRPKVSFSSVPSSPRSKVWDAGLASENQSTLLVLGAMVTQGHVAQELRPWQATW